jgi:hypothetical protein
MNMNKHTPTPWPKPEHDSDSWPDDKSSLEWWEIPGICQCKKQADADLIWRAVNSHDKLVEALEAYEELMGSFGSSTRGAPKARALTLQIRAALALAKKGVP